MLGRQVISGESKSRRWSMRTGGGDPEADLEGRDPVFVGVLKGCVLFYTDLVRRLETSVDMDFVQVSSYGKGTVSSGTVVMVKDLTVDIRERDVYLVEDIVDSGVTLSDLLQMLRARHPRSLQIVSLLSKPSRRKVPVEVDFLGTEIEDVFVVGYGMDIAERYRNLRDIREYLPE
jgi:hypoxanthine phosphoribosyltransferase